MMKTYQNHAMTEAEARQALTDACRQVETNLPLYTCLLYTSPRPRDRG